MEESLGGDDISLRISDDSQVNVDAKRVEKELLERDLVLVDLDGSSSALVGLQAEEGTEIDGTEANGNFGSKAILDPLLLEEEDIPSDGDQAAEARLGAAEGYSSPGEYFARRSARLREPVFDDREETIEGDGSEQTLEQHVEDVESEELLLDESKKLIAPTWIRERGFCFDSSVQAHSFTLKCIAPIPISVAWSFRTPVAIDQLQISPTLVDMENQQEVKFTVKLAKPVASDAHFEENALVLSLLSEDAFKAFPYSVAIGKPSEIAGSLETEHDEVAENPNHLQKERLESGTFENGGPDEEAELPETAVPEESMERRSGEVITTHTRKKESFSAQDASMTYRVLSSSEPGSYMPSTSSDGVRREAMPEQNESLLDVSGVRSSFAGLDMQITKRHDAELPKFDKELPYSNVTKTQTGDEETRVENSNPEFVSASQTHPAEGKEKVSLDPSRQEDLSVSTTMLCFGPVTGSESRSRRLEIFNSGFKRRNLHFRMAGDSLAMNTFCLESENCVLDGKEKRSLLIRARGPKSYSMVAGDHRDGSNVTCALFVEDESDQRCHVRVELDTYFGEAKLVFGNLETDSDSAEVVHRLTVRNEGSRSAYVVPVLMGAATLEVQGEENVPGVVLGRSSSAELVLRKRRDDIPEIAIHWGDEICRRRRTRLRRRASKRANPAGMDRFDKVLFGEAASTAKQSWQEEVREPQKEDEFIFMRQKHTTILKVADIASNGITVFHDSQPVDVGKSKSRERRDGSKGRATSIGLLNPKMGLKIPRPSPGMTSSCVLWILNRTGADIPWNTKERPSGLIPGAQSGTFRANRAKPLSFTYGAANDENVDENLSNIVFELLTERRMFSVPCILEDVNFAAKLRPQGKSGRDGALFDELRFEDSRIEFNPRRLKRTTIISNRAKETLEVAVSLPPDPFSVPIRRMRIPALSYVRLPIECEPNFTSRSEVIHTLMVSSTSGHSNTVDLTFSPV